MRSPLAALAALLVVTSPVMAQPGGAPPSEPAPVPAPPPVDAQAIYQRAFAAMIAGDLATARAGFAEVTATSPDPELRAAARELGRLADELAARQARIVFGAATEPTPTPTPAPGHHDHKDDHDEGRAGVIVTSTLASIYAGAVLSDLADTGDARAITGIVVATTAAGLALSLYGTKGRTITGGTAEAYSLGMMIGAGNGLLLAGPLGADTSEQWNVTVLGSMAVAAGAGFYYGHRRNPTRGQVSFSGTMATMGLATVGLGLIIIQPDIDDSDTILLAMAGGLDAGAIGGMYLGRDLTWSAGRARLVWLGALLGGILGGATGIMLFADDDAGEDANTKGRITAALALGGAWGGLFLGSRFTRNMRPDPRFRVAPAATTQVVPMAVPHGGGLAVTGIF